MYNYYKTEDFKILHDTNLTYLSEFINGYLKNGYTLTSQICFNQFTNEYYATVIKYAQLTFASYSYPQNIYGPNNTTIPISSGKYCFQHGIYNGDKCQSCNPVTVTLGNSPFGPSGY
jgi:hypothetical protein